MSKRDPNRTISDLIELINILKSILIARATGRKANDENYKLLRKELLENRYTKDKVPQFLLYNEDLEDFWNYIEPLSRTYLGRREYIHQAFKPFLSMLNSALESYSEEKQLPSIFLAHSSADKFFARKLAEQLRDSGITVWIDEAEIKVGDSLTQKIGKAIEETDFFGILISHDSVNSEWVKKELEIAVQKEIREGRDFVYPILIDKVEIPVFIRDKHYADFTSPEKFVSSLRNLIDSIHSGKTEDVEPEPKYLPARSETVTVTVHPPTLDAKTQLVHFEDINIEGFDDEMSHNPDTSNDLYNMYLKLSGAPPNEWEKIFNAERRFPRHDRWRQAWIEGEYIIIYCIPEELEEIHYEEIRVDVKITNDKYRKLLTERAQEEALKESKEEKVLTRLRDLKDRLAESSRTRNSRGNRRTREYIRLLREKMDKFYGPLFGNRSIFHVGDRERTKREFIDPFMEKYSIRDKYPMMASERLSELLDRYFRMGEIDIRREHGKPDDKWKALLDEIKETIQVDFEKLKNDIARAGVETFLLKK